MAKTSHNIIPSDRFPGDFTSRTITVRKSKLFAGGAYTLVGGHRDGNKFIDYLKNSAGEIIEIDHNRLMKEIVNNHTHHEIVK